ncbi:MAG: DUF1624 domain-containing protein [Acidaminococcaceae bacterium]|nr:DUF1624 domain-containing protein [Acidaminococcaceae bacterium]HAY60621.1 hypothetical protein [Acidaminococcaceae bacterium]
MDKHRAGRGAAAPAAAPRYGLVDTLRGLTVLSMVLYHLAWDRVFLFGHQSAWYTGTAGYVWQQSICWTFILISGFCAALPSRTRPAGRVRRALALIGWGLVITVVSFFVIPAQPILFGILTFLGAASLVTAALDGFLRRAAPGAGLGLCLAAFAVLRDFNDERLGFEGLTLLPLPHGWFELGPAGTFFGLQEARPVMADYFSLIPWIFLFWAGFFACRCLLRRRSAAGDEVLPALFRQSLPWLALPGRHTLAVYLLHQPVLYGLLTLMAWLAGS